MEVKTIGVGNKKTKMLADFLEKTSLVFYSLCS